MNYLTTLYNEAKSFIQEFHELYYSNDWDETDEPNKNNYTFSSFFDIMTVYRDYNEDDKIYKSSGELFEYLYNTIDTFFTKIFYILFMNPFTDLDYEEEEEKKEKVVEIKKLYDDKYDTKYDGLETVQLNEDEISMLPNKYVMEHTPVGNVVMYFDYDKKAFQYYSDFSVPYKYLECVSKKFCIMNKNNVYRNIKMEVDVNEFSIVRNSSSSLQNKSKSFAKLKSYNNSNPSIKSVPSTKHSELKIIQKDIVRYTHLGKLSNFSFVKNTIPKFKPVSYKDYVKNISHPDGWVVY